LRKAPEFTFTCQTELTSAIFHKFNPKLVIGGTYTGQILIWDTRDKSLPIHKTPPGGKFHSHPIYCLGVSGTNNANHIISISNDGVLCQWSMYNLSKPTKRVELKAKKRKLDDKIISEEIGSLCIGTQDNETNNIFIGADDSDIYQISLHQANDATDHVVEAYKSHSGPVHSVDLHPGDYHKNSNVKYILSHRSLSFQVYF
jgi:dynein intermediate chain